MPSRSPPRRWWSYLDCNKLVIRLGLYISPPRLPVPRPRPAARSISPLPRREEEEGEEEEDILDNRRRKKDKLNWLCSEKKRKELLCSYVLELQETGGYLSTLHFTRVLKKYNVVVFFVSHWENAYRLVALLPNPLLAERGHNVQMERPWWVLYWKGPEPVP